MKSNKTLILVGAFITSLISGNALANDGTPPFIHQLIQTDETNIEITLGIVDSGEPGLDESYDVNRNGPEGMENVMSGTTFDPDDAIEVEDRCRGGSDDTQYCKSDPSNCVDCDGDDILECLIYYHGWCETVYYFEVTDYCVPAGETTYNLKEVNSSSSIDNETIEVDPWDGECGEGSSGCSVSGVGSDANSGVASILLLIAGLSNLLKTRRKYFR